MRGIYLWVALVLTACGASSPTLMLVIDAEPAVRARIARVELNVRGVDNQTVFSQAYNLETRALPIRKSFVPRGGDLSRFVDVTISAFAAGSSAPLLIHRVRSGFARGYNEVRVTLVDACVDQLCDNSTTCALVAGTPSCVATPSVLPIGDASVVEGAADASLTDVSLCIPECQGRTCGNESRCGTSCGVCTGGQVCGSTGRCETMSVDGPRFIDAPSIAEPQPIAADGNVTVTATVTDPQGLNTIAAGEVRNPTGSTGAPGRYAAFSAAPGSGQYTATIPWSAFSETNGGLPDDVSGTTTRVLRVRFVDQDGNELVQDISVRLGGCTEALCGGRCARCPADTSTRMCMGTTCIATACSGATHLCSGQCASNNAISSCGTSCTACTPPNNSTASCDGTACDFSCNSGYRRTATNTCVSPWRRIQATGPQTPREYHALAYDSMRQRVVLFGGEDRNGLLNTTWELDSTAWTAVATANAPSARKYHALAYDIARQRVILFGGSALGTSGLNDTWAYDGTNWSQLTTTNTPPARALHAIAYDAHRERIVMFGGNATSLLSDTWEFDGTNWMQITTANAPPARSNHTMAYDTDSQHIVLFGGSTASSLTDTWTYDGTDWTAIQPSGTSISHARMAYYPALRAMVRLGWDDGTSIFDGSTWSAFESAGMPGPRRGHAMVYDTMRQRIVLFGGNNNSLLSDTWVFGW